MPRPMPYGMRAVHSPSLSSFAQCVSTSGLALPPDDTDYLSRRSPTFETSLRTSARQCGTRRHGMPRRSLCMSSADFLIVRTGRE